MTFRDVSVTDKIFHFSQCPCERWPSTLQTSYNPLLNFSLPTRGESCTVEGRGPKSVDFLMVLCQTLTSTQSDALAAAEYSTAWECVRASGMIRLVKSLGTSWPVLTKLLTCQQLKRKRFTLGFPYKRKIFTSNFFFVTEKNFLDD